MAGGSGKKPPGLSEMDPIREHGRQCFPGLLLSEHERETVENLAPCLVEHVDWIVGGSVLHPWRGFLARAEYWEDEELVQELKKAVKGKVKYIT